MILYWYLKVRVIGTIVHELAHALTVYLCGGHIDELDITSHVNHRGQYNLAHQMAISYAPLLVNTTLAVVFARWAVELAPTGLPQTLQGVTSGVLPVIITTPLLQLLALGLAFVVAAAALPSYQDARNPYGTFRHRLQRVTVVRALTLPAAVVILAVGTLPLALSYLRSKSSLFHISTEVSYGTVVLLQSTGTYVVIDPAIVLAPFSGLIPIV